jgi:hypothetical protein
MAAIFPRWTNTALPLALLLLLAGGVLPLALLLVYMRTPWNTGQYRPQQQPVQFDHRHHVVDDEIDCIYCHTGAETTALAGIPATEVCMGCHVQIWNDSPLLAAVRTSYFSGEPIPWRGVHRLPDFVYFDHSVHVSRGLGCVQCHGRVDQMPRVYQVERMNMDFCLDCHRRAAGLSAKRPAPSGRDPLFGDTRLASELAHSPPEHAVTALTTCTACHR